MKTIVVLKRVLPILVLFAATNFGLLGISQGVDWVSLLGDKREHLSETVALVVAALIHAFFYGWLTDCIASAFGSPAASVTQSLRRARHWFLRSLTVLLVGWCGIVSITTLLTFVTSDGLFSFLATLLAGLWITLTFTFYPFVVVSREPLMKSLASGFSTNLASIGIWFHLLLILFLISGGFVIIWLPTELFDNSRIISEDSFGWMTHFQWIGGYSFSPFWYIDYSLALGKVPSKMVIGILFFVNAVIATTVRIKIIGAIFEAGYLETCRDENVEELSSNSAESYYRFDG